MQADGKHLTGSQRNAACLQGSNIAHIDQEAVVDAQKSLLRQLDVYKRQLRTLHEAGLLCDDSYAAALSVCRLDYGSWELYTAPCGLTQLVRRPEEIYTGADTEHVYIQLIFSGRCV